MFFAADGTGKLVYARASGAGRLRQRLGDSATVIALREGTGLPAALADLAARGVARLMIEGGSWLLGQALSAGLADELQLAVAPVFVADPAAPRLLSGAAVPGRMQPELGTTSAASGPAVPCRMQPELGTTSAASGPAVPGRMRLIGLERAGDVAVLRYSAGGHPDG